MTRRLKVGGVAVPIATRSVKIGGQRRSLLASVGGGDVTPPTSPSGLVPFWTPSLAGSDPTTAFGVNGTAGGAAGAGPVIGSGSSWSIAADGRATNSSGRVLKVTVGGSGGNGVKARGWIPSNISVPNGPWWYTFDWYCPATNPITTGTTTKQAWGLICRPIGGASLWNGVSDNAQVFSNSWSLRFCTFPANYLSGSIGAHPFSMGTYFYGQSANGYFPGAGSYGKEDLFRSNDGTGSVINMASFMDQWVRLAVRVVPNTPGSANGSYTAFMNDAQVVHVPNVKLVADGQSAKPTAVWMETFNNSTVGSATYLWQNLNLAAEGAVTNQASVVTVPAIGADASPLMSSATNGASQALFVEPGSSQINRSGNALVKSSTEDFWRAWTHVQVGGPGAKVGIRFRQVATTTIREFNANIEEGFKPWFKWAAANEPNAGPASVTGTTDDHIPGSYTFFGQTNRTGNDMIAKRSSGPEATSVYNFYTAATRKRLYTAGTYEDIEFQLEWTATAVIMRGYINGELVVTGTDDTATRCQQAGYIGARADGSAWRMTGPIEVFTF